MRLTLSVFLMLVTTSLFAENFKICFEAWPPYAEEKNGGVEGITAEFYKEVFKRLGHTIQFSEIPPMRCSEGLDDGTYDASFFSETPTAKTFHVENSIEYWLIAAIVGKNSQLTKYSGISDFSGKKVGTVTGYEYDASLENFKGMTVDAVGDSVLNIKKIGAGRIDVLFDDPIWAEIEAKKAGIELKTLTPLIAASPCYLNLNLKHKGLKSVIDQKSKEMIKEGYLDTLYKKYIGVDFASFKTKYSIK